MPIKDIVKRREHHRLYMQKRYSEDPEYRKKQKARTSLDDKRYDVVRKALISNFRKDGCSYCEEKETCCLAAHHLDPALKEFNIGNALNGGYSPKRTEAELLKCICVCANCHSKIHAGIIIVEPKIYEKH